MIGDLKPYPAYKESALPWLGKVPRHWTEQRAKYFFREVDERSVTGKEELLSVSHVTGVTPRKHNVTMFLAESNVGHKVCRPGDLVINTMWAWMAALGMAKQIGVVSPSYGVYRLRLGNRLLPDFVDHLLRVDAYKSEYLCRSTGIRASRLRLYPEQFLRIPIVCPPSDEQAAIVRFIDCFDRRVRSYIRTRLKLLDLLAEEREAATHDAISSPATRSVRLAVVAERVARSVSRENGRVYMPIGLYNRGRGIFHKNPTKGEDLGDSTFFWIEEGDLVLSGQFAWEGAIALAGQKIMAVSRLIGIQLYVGGWIRLKRPICSPSFGRDLATFY